MNSLENNRDMSDSFNKGTLEELNKQLKALETSQQALEMIITSLLISYTNTIKNKEEVLDKINRTNYAKYLPDNRDLSKLANLLVVLGAGTFFNLAGEKLNIEKEELKKHINNLQAKKDYSEASKDFTTSFLMFLSALIGCC